MFVSTRDPAAKPSSFRRCLFSGLADDGGMFLPQNLPRVPTETLLAWSKLGYVDLATAVLSLFISPDEIPTEELRAVIKKAFSSFSSPEVVPVSKVGDVYIVELWHGPTLAFKDLGLQLIGGLIDWFVSQSAERATILVGTSGDTGSAAIHGVLNCPSVDIVVLYPRGRVTRIQELQMATVDAPTVHVIGVDGTSDDLDVPIREVFLDAEFSKANRLMSANSINIARVLIQTDILHRFLSTGEFAMTDTIYPTTSPSMDIQVPYNIERMLYLLSRGSTADVTAWMRSFETTGALSAPPAVREAIAAWGLSSVKSTMSRVDAALVTGWTRYGYLMCPHTAVGYAATQHTEEWAYDPASHGPQIVMATAHAAKFVDAVLSALPSVTGDAIIDSAGPAIAAVVRELPSLPMVATMWEKPEGEEWRAVWTQRLRDRIEGISARREGKA